MAFVSLIEYASGEFAGFEFAREEGALLVVTDFSSAGKGQAQFVGGAQANARLIVAGQSNNLFHTQTSTNTVLTLGSGSTVLFDGTTVIGSVLESRGIATANVISGVKLGTTVAMEGNSEVTFFSIDGFGFDIIGGSSVNFFSGAFVYGALKVESSSATYFNGVALANGTLESAGSSAFTLRNDSLFESTLSAPGKAVVLIPSQTLVHSKVTADGSSGFNPRINVVARTGFAINGSGLYVPEGYAVTATQAVFAGYSSLALNAQILKETQYDSAGVSEVLMNLGNPVFAYLPPAYDVVIRPYENRTVIRRKESRETEWK